MLFRSYKSGDCYIKCHEGFSYIHIWLKLFNAKRMERIDQKLVALNIAPSMALAGKCKAYGYNSICINNPLKYQKEKQIPIEEKQDFLYIGRINRDKGILDFAKTFIRYNDARNPKTKLIIYGAIEEGFEEILKRYVKIHISYIKVLLGMTRCWRRCRRPIRWLYLLYGLKIIRQLFWKRWLAEQLLWEQCEVG